MLQSRRLGLRLSALIYFGLPGGLSAQQPGPLASPNAKLDHLFGSWQGSVFVFERHVKVRAAGFGVAVFGGAGLSCVGQFEVDDKNQIVRTWWQGGGAQECWGALRKYEP